MEIDTDNLQSSSAGGAGQDAFPRIRSWVDRFAPELQGELAKIGYKGDDHFWHILTSRYLEERKNGLELLGAYGANIADKSGLRRWGLKGALRDAKMYYELEAEAGEDFLTGLLNKKRFSEDFEKLVSSIQKNHRQDMDGLCVVFFDLDNFRAVNNILGHLVGDETLRVGGELKIQTRVLDLAGRWGGEEFALVMVITDKTLAQEGPSALYRAVEAKRVDVSSEVQNALSSHEKSKNFPPDVPIGSLSGGVKIFSVKEIRDGSITPEQMLDAVDKLTYEAKNNGRDRLYSPEGEVEMD